MSLLDGNAAARKSAPIASGVLWYFPNALALVANLSLISNLRHNGDGPPLWSFYKSDDHADAVARHLARAGGVDDDGALESIKVAWRALALAETELVNAGATPGRAVSFVGGPDLRAINAAMPGRPAGIGDHYYGEHHAAEAPMPEPVNEVVFNFHPAQVEEPEGLKAGEAFREAAE